MSLDRIKNAWIYENKDREIKEFYEIEIEPYDIITVPSLGPEYNAYGYYRDKVDPLDLPVSVMEEITKRLEAMDEEG